MAECGIPLDPPSLADVGIPEEVKRDLHNELLTRGLITWADVQAQPQQNGVTGTVRVVARRHDLSEPETRALRRTVLAAYRR